MAWVTVIWSFPEQLVQGCHSQGGRAGVRQWGGGGRSPRGLQGQSQHRNPRGREEPQGKMDGGALKRGPEGTTATGRERQRTRGPFLAYSRYSGQTPPLRSQARVPEKRSVGGCGAGAGGSRVSAGGRVPGP